jgi:hypothetical protein
MVVSVRCQEALIYSPPSVSPVRATWDNNSTLITVPATMSIDADADHDEI